MEITNRVNTAHGVLVFLELATTLIAGLVTVFALLLAEGGASAVRSLGDHPSIGAGTVDLGIALLTVLLLASIGGFAVIGYHDFFDRSFETLGLLPMAIVPLVGIVAPVAYVSVSVDAASLPAWSFAILFVSSYVLALRFVAVHSMLERWRSAAVFVGIGTCLPAAVALMQFVTAAVLWSGNNRLTGTILSLATENGVPPDRRLLVVLPLSVAALLGAHRSVSTARRWSPSRPSLGVSVPAPGRSIGRTIDRVRGRVPTASSIRDSRGRLGLSALANLSSSNSGSSSRSTPSRSLSSNPASPGSTSPGSSSGGSSSSGSSSTDTSGPAAEPSSTGSSGGSTSRSAARSSSSSAVPPPSSPSPDRRSKRSDRESSPDDGATDDSTSSTETDEPTSSTESESKAAGSPSGAANRSGAAADGSDAESAGAASSSGTDETDAADETGSGADGTSSDTRIFTADFDQHGTDGDPVEHCPDCGEALPSDGVYRFCPFCGHEV